MRVPDDIQQLSDAYVSALDETLGPRFVGMFQYGAVCFPPSPVSDFDAHVVVADPFTDHDRAAIKELHERMHALPRGDDMDVWYVTRDAIARREPPQTELRPGYLDESWALHRAHVHAGRFVATKGPDPRTIVPEPTWEEIDESLQGELEFVADNVAEAPAFSVLNLCRVLYSYTTRDPVVGKFQAAMWALAALDVDDHTLIRRALASYYDKTYLRGEDVSAFYERMTGKIAAAR